MGDFCSLIGHNGAEDDFHQSLDLHPSSQPSGQSWWMAWSWANIGMPSKSGLLLPDSPDIFLNLTAREYWNFLAKYMGLSMSWLKLGWITFLVSFDIQDRQDETIDSFHMGCGEDHYYRGPYSKSWYLGSGWAFDRIGPAGLLWP